MKDRDFFAETIMKKNTILKITNPVLLVLGVSQIFTGIFAMSMPDEVFDIFHRGCGIILFALIIFHVVLNYNWIKASYFRK
jgi:hypothetical protein